MQVELDIAKQLLEKRTARELEIKTDASNSLNELFQDNQVTSNEIKDSTNQKAIDTTQNLINEISDSEVRADFQTKLDKAQALLNAQTIANGNLDLNDFHIGADKYVTGEYSGNIARISFVQNGEESKNSSLKNGVFSFYANDKKIKKTDAIFMVAYDQNGKEIVRQELKIIAETTGKVTPATMAIPGDKYITGTYTGDVARMEVTVNDVLYKGGTLSGGTFQFYSNDKVTKTTDVVVVRVFDSKNKQLDKQAVSIKTLIPTQGSITIAGEVNVGTKNIEGTFTGAVHYLVVTVNNTPYKGGTISKDGTFKFYILDKLKSQSDMITVEAFDKSGKLLDTKVIKK
ncbi:immunoglobulin-like domain-containing protein [Listeria cornellensis]|uniref:Cell wall anchor domain-containing protein n=1 Tax=Listeria cornellensis FSL F6-0969 TaxID=1265820 RepID=W7C6Y6_9LIST|nr:immunoglobulin-like domain-containing protein [Listeria cornellensis]EUJ31416.1 cell wall anchor domain-containing protein [Listeria cornellensis FSL F6-0969]